MKKVKRTRPTGMESKKTVHISKNLHGAVKAMAEEYGRTVGKQIEIVLKEWVEKGL